MCDLSQLLGVQVKFKIEKINTAEQFALRCLGWLALLHLLDFKLNLKF